MNYLRVLGDEEKEEGKSNMLCKSKLDIIVHFFKLGLELVYNLKINDI